MVGASRMGSDTVCNAIGNVAGSEFGRHLPTDFTNCLQAMFILRICNNLEKDRRSRNLAYILISSVVSITLIYDILAVAFVLVLHNQVAVVFQALGCFSAHIFASIFPLWILGNGGDILLKLRNRKTWGLLSCSSLSIFAAGASLGLLVLPGLYPKLLVRSIN